MRKLLVILTVILSLGYTATADEASHKELVEQLFVVTNMKEGFDNTCTEVIDMQVNSNPMMMPFKGVLTEFFTRYMSWENIKPEIAKLYMETFTEDELRDIVSFLSSPVGIMYTEKSFDLTMKSMEIGQKQVEEHLGELDAMLAAEADRISKAKAAESPAEAAAPKPVPTDEK